MWVLYVVLGGIVLFTIIGITNDATIKKRESQKDEARNLIKQNKYSMAKAMLSTLKTDDVVEELLSQCDIGPVSLEVDKFLKEENFNAALKKLKDLRINRFSERYINFVKEKIYNVGNNFKEKNALKAIEIYKLLGDYKDSQRFLFECESEPVYDLAKKLISSGKYKEAIEQFSKINSFKDSNNCLIECRNEIMYQEMLLLIEKRDYEKVIAKYSDIGNYKDSKQYLDFCLSATNNGKFSEGLKFKLRGDNTYSLDSVKGCKDEIIVIPELYEGLPVTEIGGGFCDGFWHCTHVKSIVIPNSVKTIGSCAFAGCINLKNVIMPSTINKIGSEAFSGCKSLIDIKIPLGISTIENHTFSGCSSLKKINLPDNIKKIGQYAFNDCKSIQTVTMSTNLEELGRNSFANCSALTEIAIPKGIKVLKSGTFEKCPSLKKVILVDGLIEIEHDAFSGCTSLEELIIPNSVTKLGDAFNNCPKINCNVFDNAVYIGNSNNPYTILLRATDKEIKSCKINDKCDKISSFAFANCKNLIKINIQSNIKEIGSYAFVDCEQLKEITVEDASTHIGKGIIKGCNKIEKLRIPFHEHDISYFYDERKYVIKNIKTIEISYGCSEIIEHAFLGIKNIENWIIPSSVKKVGDYLFGYDNDETIKNSYFNGTIDLWFDVVFLGKYPSTSNPMKAENFFLLDENNNYYKPKEIIVPDDQTVIRSGQFYCNKSIEIVRLPEGLEGIGHSAFRGCSSLKTLYLPSTIKYVEHFAFDGCDESLVTYCPLEKLPKSTSYSFEFIGLSRYCKMVFDCVNFGLYEDGKKFLEAKEYNKAIECFEKIKDLDSNSRTSYGYSRLNKFSSYNKPKGKYEGRYALIKKCKDELLFDEIIKAVIKKDFSFVSENILSFKSVRYSFIEKVSYEIKNGNFEFDDIDEALSIIKNNLIENISERLEKVFKKICEKSNTYYEAKKLFDDLLFDESLEKFNMIKGYKDVNNLIENFDERKNQKIYQVALAYKNDENYEEALKQFEKIKEYKDVKEQIIEIKNELIYIECKNLIDDKKYDEALKTLKKIKNYKDSIDLMIHCQNEIIYIEANEKIKQNNYSQAITLLNKIKNYKQSTELIKKCNYWINVTNSISTFMKEKCNINDNVVFKQFEDERFLIIAKDKADLANNQNKKNDVFGKAWKNFVFKIINNDQLTTEKDYLEYAQSVFTSIKSTHPYLLIRSLLYVIIINQVESSEKEDYHIYWFNTSYVFEKYNESLPMLGNPKYVYLVQNIDVEINVMRDKNTDAIDCAKAYSGDLEIYDLTKEKLDSLYKMISNNLEKKDSNDKTSILIEGPARSGKTIIALQLMNKYPEAKFLLMNFYFYCALKDAFNVIDVDFPCDRIFHHDINPNRKNGCGVLHGSKFNGWRKSFAFDLDFVIVDEAQRLANLPGQQGNYVYFPGFDELNKLVTVPRVSILLGDNYQRLNPKYDEGFDKIKEILNDDNRVYYNYHFSETIGIPINLVNSIKYILQPSNNIKDSLGHHTLRLLNDASEFVNDFNNNETYSKHYSTLPSYSLPYSIQNKGLSIYPEMLRYSGFNYYLDGATQGKYIYSTYEMISRELQALYLVIPTSITYSIERGIYDSSGNIDETYLFNHLYVNMTRATQKLVILTENKELYDYLHKRISEVTDNSFTDKWKELVIENQRINFVVTSSDKGKSQELYKRLQSYSFKGFIHATDYNTAINILKTNKLLSRNDADGIFVDIADQGVISRTSSFVKSKVRFYYRPNTPTLYHFNKNAVDLIIFVFNFNIINDYEVYYADGNAAALSTKFVGNIEEAMNIDWPKVFSNGAMNVGDKELIRNRNAELLVEGPVNVSKYLDKIVVKTYDSKNKIESIFPQYKDVVIVDSSYFN